MLTWLSTAVSYGMLILMQNIWLYVHTQWVMWLSHYRKWCNREGDHTRKTKESLWVIYRTQRWGWVAPPCSNTLRNLMLRPAQDMIHTHYWNTNRRTIVLWEFLHCCSWLELLDTQGPMYLVQVPRPVSYLNICTWESQSQDLWHWPLSWQF